MSFKKKFHSLVAVTLCLAMTSLYAAEMNPQTGLDHSVMPKVTQLKKRPSSTLLAGNSFMYYNNGIVQWLQGMIAADGSSKMSVSMVTIAYSGLDWHDFKSYMRPNAINSYTTLNDGSNKLVFRKDNGPVFDAVVMQDNSQGPIHPELKKFTHRYVKEHGETIRQAGGEPLIMMTWAFPGKPEMTKQLADETIKVANENNVMVVPVGLAFAEALKEKPDLKLIISDNRHPSVAGTYLETCVLYATLLHKSPEGIKWYGLGDLQVKLELAEYLQKTAWNTVSSFFGWK